MYSRLLLKNLKFLHKVSYLYSFLCKVPPSSPPPYEAIPLQWTKSSLIRGMTSLDSENLVVFYYLNVSEIWPDKRGCLWWEWPYKRGSILIQFIVFYLIIFLLFFQLNFIGVTVEAERNYIHFPSNKHLFTPVPVGEKVSPKQVYELYNGGARPVKFTFDLAPLELLQQVRKRPNQVCEL